MLSLPQAAQEIGIEISPKQEEQLHAYMALLQKWNAVYNLTALRQADDIFTHHLLDCLAVLPTFLHYAKNFNPVNVLDVGAGGGLPGLVLAIMQPEWQIHLVDKVAKKTAFITQAQAALGLGNVSVHTGRVEHLAQRPFDLITCRAFASLADWVALTQNLLAPQGYWLAMKGLEPLDEINALPNSINVVECKSITVPQLAAQRHLVVLTPKK